MHSNMRCTLAEKVSRFAYCAAKSDRKSETPPLALVKSIRLQAVGATLIIDKEDEEDEKLINADILQARGSNFFHLSSAHSLELSSQTSAHLLYDHDVNSKS